VFHRVSTGGDRSPSRPPGLSGPIEAPLRTAFSFPSPVLRPMPRAQKRSGLPSLAAASRPAINLLRRRSPQCLRIAAWTRRDRRMPVEPAGDTPMALRQRFRLQRRGTSRRQLSFSPRRASPVSGEGSGSSGLADIPTVLQAPAHKSNLPDGMRSMRDILLQCFRRRPIAVGFIHGRTRRKSVRPRHLAPAHGLRTLSVWVCRPARWRGSAAACS